MEREIPILNNMNSIGASISSSNFFHSSDSRDIILPNHDILGSIRIALDVGGSLAKIVYYTKTTAFSSGGRLNFAKFETEKIGECIKFLKTVLGTSYLKRNIMATGGGAHKYEELLEKELQVKLVKRDEMECLIRGLNFLVLNIPNEVFSYNFKETSDPVKYEDVFTPASLFPYILVNIGSGVSILKVTGDNTFERISGTSLGGGTLWGLLSLLTDARDFDEMLEMSRKGDNRNVDMLVGDIYGMEGICILLF